MFVYYIYRAAWVFPFSLQDSKTKEHGSRWYPMVIKRASGISTYTWVSVIFPLRLPLNIDIYIYVDFQLPCLITSWCDVTLGRFAVWWQDLHGDWVKHWVLTIQAWQRSNVPRFQCRRVVKECTQWIYIYIRTIKKNIYIYICMCVYLSPISINKYEQ